jgi:hypothetical protein
LSRSAGCSRIDEVRPEARPARKWKVVLEAAQLVWMLRRGGGGGGEDRQVDIRLVGGDGETVGTAVILLSIVLLCYRMILLCIAGVMSLQQVISSSCQPEGKKNKESLIRTKNCTSTSTMRFVGSLFFVPGKQRKKRAHLKHLN